MTDTLNTKGIVLKYEPWRDYDRVYTIYTEQQGKQLVRAVGVRKSKAKLAGVLEPFAELDLWLIPARHFTKIGGAVLVHRFRHLVKTLEHIQTAWYCCHLIDRLTKDNDRDQALYQLLYTTLHWFDQQSPQQLVTLSFACKTIRLLGYDLTQVAQQPDLAKIIRWLQQQPYHEVQKLRLTAPQWAQLLSVVQLWLHDQVGSV